MKKLIATFTMLCVAQILCAQSLTPEVLCNASGRITNGATSIDWTLGETITLTSQSTNNQLTSGFGQPSYILVAVPNHSVDYGIQLFPNPVSETLIIQVNPSKLQSATYQLFDMIGREIFRGNITSDFTTINCSQLVSSMYWLRIADAANQPLQSYKIVKQ